MGPQGAAAGIFLANSAVNSARNTTTKKLQSTHKASAKHRPHAVVSMAAFPWYGLWSRAV